MKLFGIKHINTRVLVSNLYFREKKDAKTKRDELNKEEPKTYVVSYGPDHRKYKH